MYYEFEEAFTMMKFGMFFLSAIILLFAAGCSFPAGQAPVPTIEIPVISIDPTEFVDPGRPDVNILSPPSGATFPAGTQIVVQSTALDTGSGVTRVDLLVNGSLVDSDNTPEGIPQNNFSIIQTWSPDQPGDYVLSVIAYRGDGVPSDPALISVNVSEQQEDEQVVDAADQACMATAKTRINIRKGPEIAQQIEDVLPLGQKVPVIGKIPDGTWLQVSYNAQVGWIFSELTYLEGNCDDVQVVNPALPVNNETQTAVATLISTYSATLLADGTLTSTPTITNTPNPDYTATNTPTYTMTPTRTLTPQFTPTFTFTPTRTPTLQFTPTFTFTPTRTPTPQFTPTFTFTPTRTHTPTGPFAPPDAEFNSPLNVPLDGNASTTDFVSFPNGDTTDKVRYDVTGLNPNSSLSGGRADLTISASCFGTGTQFITFTTGGQTFNCGQTVVSRVVTADSRTGTITINATGGTNTYVQWVLSGSAPRQ
jgi:hypothetical protein